MKKYKLYWTLLTINAGLPLDKLVVFILSILYYSKRVSASQGNRRNRPVSDRFRRVSHVHAQPDHHTVQDGYPCFLCKITSARHSLALVRSASIICA